MANTIWGVLYPGQGTGWSGWARRAKVGKRDPTFFKKSGGRKKVTKWSNKGRKVEFI